MVKKYYIISFILLGAQILAALFVFAISFRSYEINPSGIIAAARAFIIFTIAINGLVLFLFFKIHTDKNIDDLEAMALTDGLTNLYNRRYFDKYYDNIFHQSSRYGVPFSLIMIDIDHFKKINDSFGHDAGDSILKIVSDTLRNNVRKSDIVSRFGGEEFIICLPQTSIAEAFDVARKLYQKILILEMENIKKVTVSMGVACYRKELENRPKDLLKHVDNLLYRAKNNGRNRIVSEDSYGDVIEIDESAWGGESLNF